MSDDELKSFTIQFEDKTAWKEVKEDLKTSFRKIAVKYQLSIETPVFYILYESKSIKVKISWKKETLDFELKITTDKLSSEEIEVLSEIYDLLELCGGVLIAGARPENWK